MARVTIGDISLKSCELSPELKRIRDDYFRSTPEICIERPELVTRYSLEAGLFGKEKITVLEKARMYRKILENWRPVVRHLQAFEKTGNGMRPFEVRDSSPFAGSTTGKFKGVILYPEFLALNLWPELWTISSRQSNPCRISTSDVRKLNYDIFPHWMEANILEITRKSHADQLQILQQLIFFLASKPECISHTIPDFSQALGKGLRAMIDTAEAKKVSTDDDRKKEFYAALQQVLEGIIAYSRNLADEAERLADMEAEDVLKGELREIARIYRKVPESSASTFREGLTTVWVCWTAIHLENPNVGLSLGRLDQILYPLYRSDIDAGKLTLDEAVELIGYFWLKIGDHVPAMPEAGEQLFGGTGSNQAITIGGVDNDGNDAVNDLTYVMLRATELMLLRDPNLNARYHPDVNPDEYLRRLCDANINSRATPAIHNDRAVIAALQSKGETLEQARDYGVIGCVEPGSNGRFYGHTAAILLNLTSALELTLFNGKHRHTGLHVMISEQTGDPTTFTTFGEFKKAFETQTRWLVEKSTALNNTLGKTHQDFYPTPILSALFEGPWEEGKDIIEGGAVINSSAAAIIGLADVADSLSAIRQVMEDKVNLQGKKITLSDLIDAIEKDFAGFDALHSWLIKRAPKYGNDDPEADENVSYLVQLLDKAYGDKENYRGGRYRVGYWTMTIHAGFGKIMPAIPSGRKAHENFSSGITPVSGVTPDLTKALNSVSCIPTGCLSSGVALNLKYTPSDGDRATMLENFVSYVKGYFDDNGGERYGGMEIQFNITPYQDFINAVEHPDDYPELLVRVSGYTAYFKDLNPQMQKEIIDRTEYLLSTGSAVQHPPFQISPRR